jgi:hypothetical protein
VWALSNRAGMGRVLRRLDLRHHHRRRRSAAQALALAHSAQPAVQVPLRPLAGVSFVAAKTRFDARHIAPRQALQESWYVSLLDREPPSVLPE